MQTSKHRIESLKISEITETMHLKNDIMKFKGEIERTER